MIRIQEFYTRKGKETMTTRIITDQHIESFRDILLRSEKRKNTIDKYIRDMVEYSCAIKSHFRIFGNQMSGREKKSKSQLFLLIRVERILWLRQLVLWRNRSKQVMG